MARNKTILFSFIITVSAILVVNLTILFAQIDDTSEVDKTGPRDSSIEEDPTELQVEDNDAIESSTTEKVDPSSEVQIQRLFNALRKEYLDDRSEYIDMWLAVIAIVLTFFAVVIAIAGFIGFREFRRLRDEARLHVTAIQKDKVESDELLQSMRQRGSAEVFDMLPGSEEFVEDLRNLLQNFELSAIDKAIADASMLQKNGAIEDAIEKWSSIANIVKETDSELAARAWFSVGYLYSQEGEPEKAIPAYDKAIYLRPDYAKAYNNRGASNGELGQYDAAITDLNMAIVLDPNDAEAYFNRGIVHFTSEEYESAYADFDEAIRLKPTHTEALINRGLSKARLDQYDAAITDLDMAIMLDSNDAQAYYNRGCIKFILGVRSAASVNFDDSIHFENAKLDFQTALDLAIQQGLTELKNDIEERLNELNDDVE